MKRALVLTVIALSIIELQSMVAQVHTKPLENYKLKSDTVLNAGSVNDLVVNSDSSIHKKTRKQIGLTGLAGGRENSISVRGRIQTRYEYLDRLEENISSFYLRRVRVDLRGELLDGKLTWRIMPEMARTANLRDGWVNYKISNRLNIRAGQFVVPFHWLRFISGNRQHFAERGSASEAVFGIPGGYDIGVGINGRNTANNIAYAAGIFDGAGRNVRESNSAGHLYSGRFTWAITGEIPREEPDLSYSERPNFTVGTGVQYANRSSIRNWSEGRNNVIDGSFDEADWLGATTDLSLHWRGLSLISTTYYRSVSPAEEAEPNFYGWGTVLSAGYFIKHDRIELIGRVSQANKDRKMEELRMREWGVGVNLYHAEHSFKTQINYENIHQSFAEERSALIVQLHVQF